MALKPYKDVGSSSSPLGQIEWEGPWGKINPCEVRLLHFVRTDHGIEEVWTYPYEPLMRWVYKKSGLQQEIEIYTSGDKIVLRGYGLERFVEELEKRRLERVEQRVVRFAAVEPHECCVTEIKIESDR